MSHPIRRRLPQGAILLALLLIPAGRTFAQKPVAVRIDGVDPKANSITITFRDAARTMQMASTMRVTVDDHEATVADIRPGDAATVVYDKTVHAMVSVDIWRAKPVDVRHQLLADGGFEQISDAASLLGWERQSGHVMSSMDARNGSRSLLLRVSAGNEEARIFSTPRKPLKPGTTYRLAVWAKGEGRLGLNVYQYGEINFAGTDFLRDQPSLSLTDEWQELRCDYKPTDRLLTSASLALVLSGKEAQAVIDDASFVFSESDNPGIMLEDPPPTRDLRIAVEVRQAKVEIAIAGRPAAITDGVAAARVTEGLATVAVRAEATGYRPGVRLRVLDQPETNGRWRATDGEFPDWYAEDFDDRAWPQAPIDRDGFAWPKASRAQVACFRQVLLWNESHHGPNRCILPRTHEWAFSCDGFDNLLLALYSPLPFPMADYEFILDVPEAFELFGSDEPYWQRYITNERPLRVTQALTHRNGQPYTRYRIAFAPGQVPADATHYCWLPLRLRGGTPGKSAPFFFHRRGNGNFTECEHRLPVTILPPINGRQPQNILVSQYCPNPFHTLAPQHMRATISQSAAIGFNLAAMTITEPGWGAQWNAYLKSFHYELEANGIGTIISNPGQFPLHGSHVAGHQSDQFLRWVGTTPRAQATYFDGRRWNPDENDMYCPTYMTGEGAVKFREIVRRTYAEILTRTPKAKVLFLDYEAPPWVEGSRKSLGSSFCFCEACKQCFREHAKLPPDVEMSNEAIHAKHYHAWADFHDWQVTEIQRQMKAVANALGLEYMVYSYAGYMSFWSNIRGKIDIAFPGSPGSNVASGHLQKSLDEEGKFLRVEQAVPKVIGQRFSFLGIGEAKGGWRDVNALSDDGFVHPKSWKSQILRIVAAFGGGVDLQSAGECVAGMPYWIGEATRIIATHEDLFIEGERADHLASSEQIAYPDLLVLRNGRRRLVLLFNETDADRAVTLANLEFLPGQTARVFEQPDAHPAESIDLVVPAGDAVAVVVE
ncbi:MAG: hypothetical protein WCR51_01550 [Planctomycetia bacterium]